MTRASVCLCLILTLSAPVLAASPTKGNNLARGKACRLEPAPNYDFCTDAADAQQLTDGQYNGCEWTNKGTVGWSTVKNRSAVIDIDLGKPAAIGKITFDTIGGAAGVTFPSAVLVFVSGDGQQYRYLCDVLNETIPQTQARNHRFAAEGLKGWGRYVRIVPLSGGFFLFCDEIEVMEGDHAETEARYPNEALIPAAEVEAHANGMRPWANQKNASLTLLREAQTALSAREPLLRDAELAAQARRTMEEARQAVVADMSAAAIDHSQGPPYRDHEASAFRMIAKINARAWPGRTFVVWHKDAWDTLGPLEGPKGLDPQPPRVRVEMMNNEWATASFVVTSASEEAQTLSLTASEFSGPAGSIRADEVLRLAHVVHAEAYGFNYVDDAIVPLAEGPVILKPGVSKRIWLTFKTRGLDVKPGTYQSTVRVAAGDAEPVEVPVELRIWPLRFPDQLTSHSVTWGYFDDPNLVGHEQSAAQDLLDHYNTALVLNHRYLPRPRPDQDGNLTEPLDFSRVDQMLAWNPQCRMWLLWVGFQFDLEDMGTGEFDTPKWEKAFTQYVTQVRDHLAQKGIGKNQFAWYWTDEPGSHRWPKDVTASKLLKKIDPEMLVWANPGNEVSAEVLEDGLSYVDIYCPSSGTLASVSGVSDVVQRTRLTSWMYASGSSKNAGPLEYYRWFAWRAWKYKLGGVGMWVYVDENAATLSDYTSGPSFALIYRGNKGVIGSKRWDAWRQGIADYEYLHMLATAVAEAQKSDFKGKALSAAQRLLSDGVDKVVGNNPDGADKKSAHLAEQYRLEMLRCLSELSGQTSDPASVQKKAP